MENGGAHVNIPGIGPRFPHRVASSGGEGGGEGGGITSKVSRLSDLQKILTGHMKGLIQPQCRQIYSLA